MTGDERLREYLTAADERSDATLAVLYSEVLLPRCRLVVRARLARHIDDVDDVTHEVVLRLIRRLQEMRAVGDVDGVRSVTEWAAGAATKACSAFLRKEHPLRTHLANVLRYRLGKSFAFSIWKGMNGRLLCGWRRCRHAEPISHAALEDVLRLPRVVTRLALLDADDSRSLVSSLRPLFACAEGPVYFSDLVSELTRSTFGDGSRLIPIGDVQELAGGQRADAVAIRGELLRAMWEAVSALPRDERLSLLLNLRGHEGLSAWWDDDVVSVAAVTAAAGISVQEIGRLPLSDAEIADRLDLADLDPARRRQKVINLRRSARRRLGQRFGDLFGHAGPVVNMRALRAST
jgi:hypothetical protein